VNKGDDKFPGGASGGVSDSIVSFAVCFTASSRTNALRRSRSDTGHLTTAAVSHSRCLLVTSRLRSISLAPCVQFSYGRPRTDTVWQPSLPDEAMTCRGMPADSLTRGDHTHLGTTAGKCCNVYTCIVTWIVLQSNPVSGKTDQRISDAFTWVADACDLNMAQWLIDDMNVMFSCRPRGLFACSDTNLQVCLTTSLFSSVISVFLFLYYFLMCWWVKMTIIVSVEHRSSIGRRRLTQTLSLSIFSRHHVLIFYVHLMSWNSSRQPVSDFLSVNNTNLHAISYRYPVIIDYWSNICFRQGVTPKTPNSRLRNLASRHQI